MVVLSSPTKNNSPLNCIEKVVLRTKIPMTHTAARKSRQTCSDIIRVQRQIDPAVIDKKLIALLKEHLNYIVPFMTVRDYNELNEILGKKGNYNVG